MKKNILLTLLFSIIPGCGQMYQGYMKRGVSLMFWFGISIFFTAMEIGIFIVLIVISWAYSFFDTFNIRNLKDNQRAAFADEYLPSKAWLKKQKILAKNNNVSLGKVVGWGLVLVGVLAVLNNVMNGLWRYFEIWTGGFRNILVPFIIIGIGVYMLRANHNKAADSEDGDSADE